MGRGITHQHFASLGAGLSPANDPVMSRVIRKVAVVGAYQCVYGGNDKDDKDSPDFTKLIDYLVQQGVPVAKDFKIEILNLHMNRDFLVEAPPCDLLYMSYLPNFKETKGLKKTFASAERPEDFLRKSFDRAVSHLHCRDKWHQTIQRSNPAYVATFGGINDLSTHDLLADGYEEILPTPRWRFSDKLKPALRFGLPTPWIGLNIRSDVRAALEETLPVESALHERIAYIEVVTKPLTDTLGSRLSAWITTHLTRD